MELLPKGNVGGIFCDKGKIVPNDIAVSVMRQLFDALEYIHKLGIVHLRIQLDNLLVSSTQPVHVKLTGFEFSTCGKTSVLPLITSCPPPEAWEIHYRDSVAPQIWEEILKDRGYLDKRPKPLCNSPVDIWSAGIICSQLTLGKSPCYLDAKRSKDEQAADYVDLLLTARSGIPSERSKIWAQKLGLSSTLIPSVLLEFLQKLLNPEPESRPKAGECLSDTWLIPMAHDPIENAQKSYKSASKRRKLNPVS